MANKIYPEWVQKHKTKGTSVRKVGDNYYLYKHSSKRVPGKKNPVPNDTYIGKITPDGVIRSDRKKVDAGNSEIIVREFGFSSAVEMLCPVSWKEPLGGNWQEVLDFIIVRESPESYITLARNVIKELDPHIQYGAQKTALQRRMKQEHGVDFKALRSLSTIYIVSIGRKNFLSKISDGQRTLLERLGIELEVH